MNTLSIFTISALLAFGAMGAYAQNTKTSVPEYEQKNTANLESQAGFVGLNVGEEITEDNTERSVTGLDAVEDITPAPAPMTTPVIIEQDDPAIIIEKSVVGNTDTGVNLDEIKSEIDDAY